jgi:hypothetical protein
MILDLTFRSFPGHNTVGLMCFTRFQLSGPVYCKPGSGFLLRRVGCAYLVANPAQQESMVMSSVKVCVPAKARQAKQGTLRGVSVGQAQGSHLVIDFDLG